MLILYNQGAVLPGPGNLLVRKRRRFPGSGPDFGSLGIEDAGGDVGERFIREIGTVDEELVFTSAGHSGH
jgi:hypothetical protein